MADYLRTRDFGEALVGYAFNISQHAIAFGAVPH